MSCDYLFLFVCLFWAELQDIAAGVCGMEAALFVPSGTMGNLIAGERVGLLVSFFPEGLLGITARSLSRSDGALQGERRRDDCGRPVPYPHLRARRERAGDHHSLSVSALLSAVRLFFTGLHCAATAGGRPRHHVDHPP